jgi:hypothetical protein
MFEIFRGNTYIFIVIIVVCALKSHILEIRNVVATTGSARGLARLRRALAEVLFLFRIWC